MKISLGRRLAGKLLLHKKADTNKYQYDPWGQKSADEAYKTASKNFSDQNLKNNFAYTGKPPQQELDKAKQLGDEMTKAKAEHDRVHHRDYFGNQMTAQQRLDYDKRAKKAQERFQNRYNTEFATRQRNINALRDRAVKAGIDVGDTVFQYDPTTFKSGREINDRASYEADVMDRNRHMIQSMNKYYDDMENKINQQLDVNKRYTGNSLTGSYAKTPATATNAANTTNAGSTATPKQTPDQYFNSLVYRGQNAISGAIRKQDQQSAAEKPKLPSYTPMGYYVQEAQNRSKSGSNTPVGPRMTENAGRTNPQQQQPSAPASSNKNSTQPQAPTKTTTPNGNTSPQQGQTGQAAVKPVATNTAAPNTTAPKPPATNTTAPKAAAPNTTAPKPPTTNGTQATPASNQGSTIDLGGGQSVTKVKTNDGMYQVTFPDGRKTTYTTDPGNDPAFYNRAINKYNDRQAIKTQTAQFGQDARKHFDAYNKLSEEYQRVPERLSNGQPNPLKAHLGKRLAEAKKIMKSNYGQHMGDPYAKDVDRPFDAETFTYNNKNSNFHRVNWQERPKHLTNAVDIAKWERDKIRSMQLDQQVALMKQRKNQQLRDEFNNKWNPQPVAKPTPQPSKPQPKTYSQMTPQEHRAASQRTVQDAMNAFGLDSNLPISFEEAFKGW